MHLQGFGGGASVANGYGCTACLHSASDDGFKVDGVWGAQDEFVVLVLWDADNQFEHPRFRYLPDWDFDGIKLEFDIETTGCVPIDSDLFPWIDWAYLNVQFADGSVQQVRLSDVASAVEGSYTKASATFTLSGQVTGLDYVGLEWCTGVASAAMWHADYGVYGVDTLESIVSNLAAAINSETADYGMSAVASGTQITLTWEGFAGSLLGKGANGNRIGVSGTVSGWRTESWDIEFQCLAEGKSPDKWHIAIDSSSLTQTRIQKMWLTFAPDIQRQTFAQYSFSVAVTGWTVTDVNGKRALKVAGPGSVRLEENSAWVARAGYWEAAPALGWWSQGRAIRSAYSAYESRTLTIETHCGQAHDIWLGTRLDFDCGLVQATLDGGSPVTLDCYGGGANVRRKLFSGVAAGQHEVVLTLIADKNSASQGWYCYFDFLECAVAGDVPDAPEVRADFGLATDFDTDNSYKLSPERLVWGIQRSGLVGEVDHYAGVFWWPKRMLVEGSWNPQVTTVTFSGAPTWGKRTSITIAGLTFSKVNFISDTATIIAAAFAAIINQGSTGFWASAKGTVLTITGLACGAPYHAAITVDTDGDSGFTAAVETVNPDASELAWQVYVDLDAPMNDAVAAWHADYFAALQAAGIGVVMAFSCELVNPPDADGAVWVQRFADGSRVDTATGFGTLKSSQVAFSAGPQAYLAAVFAQVAGLLSAAALPARLQCGEWLWWYQAGGSPASMAFYDADTTAAAQAELGRALATFAAPDSDPSVNAYADANFLRARLKAFADAVRASVVAAVPGAVFELLWPLDVDDPAGAPLMRYVNLPAEWTARDGSGWDTFVSEGFQYGGTDHDVDKARKCAEYPFAELSWDRAHSRYLMGWFSPGWPWAAEYRAARVAGPALVKGWALDHLFLMGWNLPLPAAAQAMAAVRRVAAR